MTPRVAMLDELIDWIEARQSHLGPSDTAPQASPEESGTARPENIADLAYAANRLDRERPDAEPTSAESTIFTPEQPTVVHIGTIEIGAAAKESKSVAPDRGPKTLPLQFAGPTLQQFLEGH